MMASKLSRLNLREIEILIDGLKSASIRQPFVELGFIQAFGAQFGPRIFGEFKRLEAAGFNGSQILVLLEELRADRRERSESFLDKVKLVWTGPETEGTLNRDTRIVVRELF